MLLVPSWPGQSPHQPLDELHSAKPSASAFSSETSLPILTSSRLPQSPLPPLRTLPAAPPTLLPVRILSPFGNSPIDKCTVRIRNASGCESGSGFCNTDRKRISLVEHHPQRRKTGCV